VLARYPQYTGLLTITAKGDLHCDSLRTGRTLNLSQRGYFRHVTESLQPAFEVVIGGLTGIAVLQVAFPVLDRRGSLAYVLLASMDLSEYSRRIAAASPYPGLEMSLWNRSGVLLLRRPPGNGAEPGKDDSASPLFRFAASAGGERFVTLPGAHGGSTAWVRASVQEPRGGGARLVLGLSPQTLRAHADRELNTALALMMVATLAALAIAWYFADVGIGAPPAGYRGRGAANRRGRPRRAWRPLPIRAESWAS
jgi:hypothetical protein